MDPARLTTAGFTGRCILRTDMGLSGKLGRAGWTRRAATYCCHGRTASGIHQFAAADGQSAHFSSVKESSADRRRLQLIQSARTFILLHYVLAFRDFSDIQDGTAPTAIVY